MLKISDILKKAREQGEKSGQKKNLSGPPVPAAVASGPKFSSPPEDRPKVCVSKTEEFQRVRAVENEQAREVYRQAVEEAKRVFAPLDADRSDLIPRIEASVEKLSRLLQTDENSLLKLFFQEYFTEKGFLYQHAVNVCVLSLKLGLDLGYDWNNLKLLGTGAFLHDLGLVRHETLISQPRKLVAAEYSEVKKHPLDGQEILKTFAPDIDFAVFDIVRQEHERLDGSGYPFGLKKDEISKHARIVGLADEYESVCHSRPYRAGLPCLAAIQELLKKKNKFDHLFFKQLINSLGVFFVGSMVELSTREIGIVVRQNYKMPLRPVVEVTHGQQGQRLKESKLIDLGVNCAISVKDTYVETCDAG